MTESTNRVVVTGAAGFVGVAVVAELLKRGKLVLAVDDFCVGSPQRLPGHANLSVARLDVRDNAALGEQLASFQPEHIVHLAAHHFIPYCAAHPSQTLSVNVVGTQSVLDASAAAGCGRLVFASTADVYAPSILPHRESDPLGSKNVYGLSKETAERQIQLWRLGGATTEPVIVRLFNVIGPLETNPHVLPAIIGSAQRGRVLRLGNVSPRRDYIYVGDVAHVLADLLDLRSAADTTLNLGTGESWSVVDLVNNLSDVIGREYRIEVDPTKLRPVDRPNLQADVTKLDELLPLRPRTTLADSIRLTLQADHPALLLER